MEINMEKERYIIGIDPAGVYKDKHGHIGIAVLSGKGNDFIWRKRQIETHPKMDVETLYEQLNLHLPPQEAYDFGEHGVEVMIEDFVLYDGKKDFQKFGSQEVSQMIGWLEAYFVQRGAKVHKQPATRIKKRWDEHILEYNGYIVKDGNRYVIGPKHLEAWQSNVITTKHERDAFKHAIHLWKFPKD